MKKLFLIVSVALASCNTVPVDTKADQSHRIIGKEHNVYGGIGYQIIEVDGKEYISANNGGMCPLIKDTTKNY